MKIKVKNKKRISFAIDYIIIYTENWSTKLQLQNKILISFMYKNNDKYGEAK